MDLEPTKPSRLLTLFVVFWVLLTPSELAANVLPWSCFVVHGEPTTANEEHFASLEALMALANGWGIPVTIDFTAQWAEMILGDDETQDAVATWLDIGHEIGVHHHAYWATLERVAQWDGYTNTLNDELSPRFGTRYRGTMDDFMDLLLALPGERISGCLGLDDDRDLLDWPGVVRVSTTGHTLEDCISTPIRVSFPEGDAWAITHGLLLQPPGALVELYDRADGASIFCIVAHVYNFQEDPLPFDMWFRFLHEREPEGTRRRTVSDAIEAWGGDV